VKPSKHGERGIVHVCTWLKTHADVVVCAFERKALIRSGRLGERSEDVGRSILLPELNELERLPSALRKGMGVLPAGGFSGYFEDFEPGQVLAHGNGRTISDSEPMQLSMLLRNSHPLHFDEVYCAENSFTGHRIVYGGLVLGWVFSLMSRDVAGNALWEMGIDEGAHPHPTHAGDTLFAACRVESKKDVSPHAGMVTFRVIGLKNHHPEEFLKKEADIFEPERTKVKGRELTSKILEVSRTLLIRKRP
jgi:2-methylfumaryl-CoA hydratase